MNKNIKYIVLLLLLFLPFAYGSGIHNLKNSNTSKRGESLEKFKIIEINLDLLRVDCDTLSTIGIAIANSIAKLAISENREIFSEWKMRNNRCNLETAKQIHNIFFNVDSSLIKRSNIQLIYSNNQEEYVTFYISKYKFESKPEPEIDTTGFPKPN